MMVIPEVGMKSRKKTVNDSTDDMLKTYAIAATKMLLGHRKMKDGVIILAGDALDIEGRVHIGQMAKDNKTDLVHFGFGADETGDYRMTGITLILPRDMICFVQPDCRLWLSPTGNRAVIVPRPEARGHFRLTLRELIHIDSKPANALGEGISRADAWIERWSRSRGQVPGNANLSDVSTAA